LYLKSLLRGVCEGPPADPEFRREVEEEVGRIGLDALRQRLEQVDPLSAAKLHPNDQRRMIRALEVYKLTGTPISHYQMQFDNESSVRGSRVFVLSWDRSQLHQRINSRVETMFEQGFVDEVRGLLEKHKRFSATALQGVGYREVAEVLQKVGNLDDAVDQTKIRTRRFARRQETWFRGLQECKWISLKDSSVDEEIVSQLRNAN
jgi:tRNA dimethylallyltransferase